MVVVAQEAQQDAVGQHGPQVSEAGVEKCLEHVVGGFGFDPSASGHAGVQVLGGDDSVDDRRASTIPFDFAQGRPAPVGEGVAQLARFVQDGVTAQVDRVKVQQLEQGQQPAGADLGDVHHGQIGADGVPALQEQFPGGGNGVFQHGGALGGLRPGQGEGRRLDPALAGARFADVLYEGGADQPAGGGDVGRYSHNSVDSSSARRSIPTWIAFTNLVQPSPSNRFTHWKSRRLSSVSQSSSRTGIR